MTTASYHERRGQIETYFDRTAADTWARLTSDAPVGSIRATVRAGRDEMRATLLGWLPRDLSGKRLLDAGCGTGALSVEAARRGADVTAVDLSPTLIALARDRAPTLVALARDRAPDNLGIGQIAFLSGDMLDPAHGAFDHVVAMDSLIHYRTRDVVDVLAALTERARRSLVFTFAPRTPTLAAMHAVGRCFPRRDRAPAIEPVSEVLLHRLVEQDHRLSNWRIGRTRRIVSGFYISQGMELVRA